MTMNEELIAEALERSRKGVQEDDGYTYSIPSADIAATNDLLRRLAGALAATSTPVEVTERERLADILRGSLHDAMLCGRVWEAWGYWTMTEDDFSLASEDDEYVSGLADAILAAGFRAPAADGDLAQSRIDQHMQKIAHRVMDVFENAEEDTLADDIMQDVFGAIGLTESFGVAVESEEGAA